MLKNIFHNQRGLSLIEMMAAIAIFTVLSLTTVSIFQMVVEGQRGAMATQNIQESMRYGFEIMGKEIRTAKKQPEGAAIPCAPATINKLYNTSADNTILYFMNKKTECVKYYLDNNRIKIDRWQILPVTLSNYITPQRIEVSDLKFFVNDDPVGGFHSKQASVTMRLTVKATGKVIHEQAIQLQTFLSSRYYE